MVLESLDAFRAHCGDPTMPLEACDICSKIPRVCHRFEKGGDVERDDVPPEIEKLVRVVGENDRAGVVLRCPACHRLYVHKYDYEFIYGGSEDTYHYERLDVEGVFRNEWIVRQRLPNNEINWVASQDFFLRHAIVRFHGSHSWFAVGPDNERHELTGHPDVLARLIETDPPGGLDDLERAKRYAKIIDDIEHPTDRTVYSSVRWKQPLTPEEQRQVDDVLAASRIEAPVAERDGDRVVVRWWLTSGRRLVCRVMTVERSGRTICEDAVIAEDLPIP